jgi:hypothetical protein
VNGDISARVCAPVREQSTTNEVTMEQAKPKSMTAFRRQNTRIDYYPTQDAAAVIERLRKCNPTFCTRELLDVLIVKGGKVFFSDSVVAAKNS